MYGLEFRLIVTRGRADVICLFYAYRIALRLMHSNGRHKLGHAVNI